jgi:hypothetical protein
MLRTAVINTEYTNSGEIRLKNITTLKVFNAGDTIVFIAGLPVYPNQKEIIVPADNTISNVVLDVQFQKFFLEKEPTKKVVNGVVIEQYFDFQVINKEKVPYNDKIVVIYKHII